MKTKIEMKGARAREVAEESALLGPDGSPIRTSFWVVEVLRGEAVRPTAIVDTDGEAREVLSALASPDAFDRAWNRGTVAS